MNENTTAVRTIVFKVSCVEKADPGDDDDGSEAWYRYILENGRSTIVGQRRGTLKDVTDYATNYTEQLNERSSMSRSTWSTRGKKSS